MIIINYSSSLLDDHLDDLDDSYSTMMMIQCRKAYLLRRMVMQCFSADIGTTATRGSRSFHFLSWIR